MVESVVELHSELNAAYFGRTRCFELPAQRQVGGALGRPEDDADSAVTPAITVADGHGCAVQGAGIEIAVELGFHRAGLHDIAVRGPGTHLRARGSAVNV